MRTYAIFIALALVLAATAQLSNLPADFFMNNSIQASVSAPELVNFTSPSGTIKFDITVYNNYSEPLSLYFFNEKDSKWQLIGKLGPVASQEYKTFEPQLNFQYSGLAYDKVYYAVIAPGDPSKGFTFSIAQNWLNYEKEVKGILLNLSIPMIPVFAVFLVLVLIYLTETAYTSKTSGEYTTRTLFIPNIRGRPVFERIADVIINPAFWLVEIIIALLMILIIRDDAIHKLGAEFGTNVFFLGFIAAIAMPLIYFTLVWLAQRHYEKEPIRFTLSMLLWGTLAAFFAYILNSASITYLPSYLGGNIGNTTTILIGIGLLAPVIEEILKGIGVLIASGHHELDSTFNGLTYGFACGLGFSIIENLVYFVSQSNPLQVGITGWLVIILNRSVLNSLAHGAFTGTTGAVLGFVKSRPETKKYTFLAFLPAVFIAVALHSAFNISALADGYAILNLNFPIFVFNPLLVLIISMSFLVVFILSAADLRRRKGIVPVTA